MAGGVPFRAQPVAKAELIMLIDSFAEQYVLLTRERVSDGEGGLIETWGEGAAFTAAVTFDSTLSARVAEHDGVTSLYTVTVREGEPLKFHDVFKRASDGKVFRVTSDGEDVQTPSVASFAFSQVTAEEWSLADGN